MDINSQTVVFITGGASGLGEAFARYCFALGANVAIADINRSRMQALKEEMPRLLTIHCDVTKESDLKNAVQKTVDAFGGLHVAMASAGTALSSTTLSEKKSLDMEQFELVTKINLFGSMYMAKHAAIQMSK